MTSDPRDEETTTASMLIGGETIGVVLHAVVFSEGGMLDCELPPRGTLTIGRSRDCQIRINHRSVSREHATLRVRSELGKAPLRPRSIIELTDCGSANGTRVNGRLLAKDTPVAVTPGDVIEVGSAFLMIRARLSGEAESSNSSESNSAPTAPPPPPLPDGVIVADPTMKRLHELADLVARSDLNVLLLGETGVGKDVFAEAIHRASARQSGPFVTINCAALPDSLFESELFGYERGAFTGANAMKKGLLETAHRGTVFLDEVGELTPQAQAKLLRVIERREFTRIGNVTMTSIDVRFVAATNRDLEIAAADGTFRRDLYFRLNGVAIPIPPLRARRVEIGLLAQRFVTDMRRKLGHSPLGIAPEAMSLLERHGWPGNVRELRNVVERAALLCKGRAIASSDLILSTHSTEASIETASLPAVPSKGETKLKAEFGELERRRILETLEECGGNQSRAAKVLGISRRRLLNRLDDYGVARPRKGSA